MTQEEKQLLLKDLCGRLPYGVKIEAFSWQRDEPRTLIECTPSYTGEEIVLTNCAGRVSVKEIKPYLRPMSSMTKDEYQEYDEFEFISASHFAHGIEAGELTDWLNAHHFDYRGLIPMGLALEAPEGMYK